MRKRKEICAFIKANLIRNLNECLLRSTRCRYTATVIGKLITWLINYRLVMFGSIFLWYVLQYEYTWYPLTNNTNNIFPLFWLFMNKYWMVMSRDCNLTITWCHVIVKIGHVGYKILVVGCMIASWKGPVNAFLAYFIFNLFRESSS